MSRDKNTDGAASSSPDVPSQNIAEQMEIRSSPGIVSVSLAVWRAFGQGFGSVEAARGRNEQGSIADIAAEAIE
jgi:hypothetical protein